MCHRKLLRPLCSHLLRRHFGSEVRVRFAPSPTGKLHLGGLRTALFNFLFARAHQGKFILRIEDTDQQRVVVGAAQRFEFLLNHFGLYRDEGPSEGGEFGPYIQSQRVQKYADAANELVRRGHAYHCFCSPERLEMLRRNALRRNEIPRYDNHCRQLTPEEVKSRLADNCPNVIRFKIDREKIAFQDEVFGGITQFVDEGDFVILKSDGFPTYHLANVVDDRLMKISHVIRGMEWVSSTPKHIKLYRAFEWPLPSFIHLPLITRDGAKKLSKRDKDAYVDYYVEEKGYLPVAVLNFLIRNGSGIRDFDLTRLYSLDEMVANFDSKLIGRRNFMMDQTSLDKYGQLSFADSNFEKNLLALITDYFGRRVTSADSARIQDAGYVQKALQFMRGRGEKFTHLMQLVDGDFRYFFSVPTSPLNVLKSFNAAEACRLLENVRKESEWNADTLKRVAETSRVKYPDIMLLLRLSLIDNESGPPVMDLVNFFGREEFLKRTARMIVMLEKSRDPK